MHPRAETLRWVFQSDHRGTIGRATPFDCAQGRLRPSRAQRTAGDALKRWRCRGAPRRTVLSRRGTSLERVRSVCHDRTDRDFGSVGGEAAPGASRPDDVAAPRVALVTHPGPEECVGSGIVVRVIAGARRYFIPTGPTSRDAHANDSERIRRCWSLDATAQSFETCRCIRDLGTGRLPTLHARRTRRGPANCPAVVNMQPAAERLGARVCGLSSVRRTTDSNPRWSDVTSAGPENRGRPRCAWPGS